VGQYVFKLPDVGEGTAEAEIVAWHVRVGDMVQEDAPLVDVMTDKATVEMTSPVAGKIISIHGEPGDMAPVGGPIAVFETEGGADLGPPAPSPATVAAAAPKSAGEAPAVQKTTAAKTPEADGLTSTPANSEPRKRRPPLAQSPRSKRRPARLGRKTKCRPRCKAQPRKPSPCPPPQRQQPKPRRRSLRRRKQSPGPNRATPR